VVGGSCCEAEAEARISLSLRRSLGNSFPRLARSSWGDPWSGAPAGPRGGSHERDRLVSAEREGKELVAA